MTMSNQGQLVIVSGPSGVGKTTVAKELVESGTMERVVTATTRARRDDERDGVDYYFLTKKDFESKIENGEFLEFAEVHGNLYGTPREPVELGVADGKTLLLTIDVQGARQIRDGPGDLPVVTIFLLPPSEAELDRRLESRGSETEENLRTRRETAQQELKEKNAYDHLVVNDTLSSAVGEILELVNRSPQKE